MRITIYRVGAEPETQDVPGAGVAGYAALRALLMPLLDGGEPERVNVLHDGVYTDMFVDEMGVSKGLPVNYAATAIYLANWLSQHPEADPESLPAIYGTAILFASKVWK